MFKNRVLLVEADAPLRRSLKKFLSLAGCAFESCSSACEALNLAGKIRHDVAILGYHLPDADCPSLIEKLKLLHPHCVVIVISRYDFQSVADHLARVKIDSFLKKPFDLADFELALSNAFSKVRQSVRKEDRQPDSVPASIWTQGTHGKRS
jgi:DNA-binding NtrC family response regulator